MDFFAKNGGIMMHASQEVKVVHAVVVSSHRYLLRHHRFVRILGGPFLAVSNNGKRNGVKEQVKVILVLLKKVTKIQLGFWGVGLVH